MPEPGELKVNIWEQLATMAQGPQSSEHGTEEVWDIEAVDDTRIQDNWEIELREAYEEGLARSQRQAEELTHQVSRGLMTPEDADLNAKNNLNFTLSQPLQYFDLRAGHMYLWSPEMVAAWITWRRSVNVLRHYESSYSDARVWVGNTTARSYFISINGWPAPELAVKGHQLLKLEKTSIRRQFLDHDGNICNFTCEWENELKAGIVAHRIRSFGRDYQSGCDWEIPSNAWMNGGLEDRGGQTLFVINGSAKYHDIRFIAADVLKAFEPDYGVFRPWKSDPKKMSPRERIAIEAFRKEWPHGFPWHWSGPEKFEQVMRVLNAAAPGKFRYNNEQDAFDKFLQRLADKALEEKVDSRVIL